MATVAKQASRGAKQASRGAKQVSQGGLTGAVSTVRSWPSRFRSYVDGIKREMRLVTWPSRKQVQATTVVVLVTVFAFAVFFGVVDYVLAMAQTSLYQYFTR